MQIIRDISAIKPEPCVATIGFFDGVHAPEREVIDLVLRDFAVDDFNKIEDPRGMVAVRLDIAGICFISAINIR